MSLSGWLYLAGPLAALGAGGGLWWSATAAERELLEQSDAALARHAVQYLAVVTPPGPDRGYDPRRLLAGVHTLADASFWPGGFQLALGQVPLVADTLDLAPVPDSVVGQLARGSPHVLTTHGRIRAAVVPFPDRDREGLLGWAAAWRTVRPAIPSAHAGVVTALAIVGILALVVAIRLEPLRRWRLVAFACAIGFLGLLGLDLALSVYRTARVATDTRLLTLRRLVEVAATAEGVKQSRLREIGLGTTVRVLRSPVESSADVTRGEEDGERVARIVAATPRTQGGVAFSIRPVEQGLGELWLRLLAWLALGALALALTGWAAGIVNGPVRPGRNVARGVGPASGASATFLFSRLPRLLVFRPRRRYFIRDSQPVGGR